MAAKLKQKTRKAAAKRLKKTATGKIKRSKAGRGHLLSCKTRKRKRNLRSPGLLAEGDRKRLTNLIPD